MLTSIGGFLAPVFKASGEFGYPTYKDQAVKQIYCSIEPFSPPKITLFQQLTYRMPKEYVEKNNSLLELRILNIAQELDLSHFITKEKLQEKEVKCSTGQGKLVILIGAILYKEYLDQPVLLLMDETLANLDTETTNIMCSTISGIFADSVKISVDHQARSNHFYTDFFDLAEYRVMPIDDRPEMLGEVQ